MHDFARPNDAPLVASGSTVVPAAGGQVGQAQPGTEDAQAADAEDLPAVPAVAEAGPGAEESEHQNLTAPGAGSLNNSC